jgi:putative membrane protein
MKNLRELFRIAAVGLVMGAAEVVPGVSGGTIAFISGIYERLINAIRQFTPYLILRLKDEGLKSTWEKVDATFLLVLFAGMGISILIFASAVSYMLHHEPIAIWSFFFGLVVVSALVVSQELESFGIQTGLGIGIGVVIGVVITHLVPITLEPTPLMLFVGGSIAVCAWILPGLSGSFILLLLGLYGFVIEAIKSLDLLNLAFLALGAAIGLVNFSKLLSRLFSRFRNDTLSVLLGFMLGSLAKLWPWKNTTSYQIKADGSQIPLIQEPVLPNIYSNLTGQDAQIMTAIGCALVGGALVLVLQKAARIYSGPES